MTAGFVTSVPSRGIAAAENNNGNKSKFFDDAWRCRRRPPSQSAVRSSLTRLATPAAATAAAARFANETIPGVTAATAAAAAAASDSSSSAATPRRQRRVAVVGGGVVGLSTALRLAQEEERNDHESLEISVLAKGFGEETTSYGAGGLWEPYKLGETAPELVNRWSKETLDFLLDVARGKEGEDEGGRAGVIEGEVFQYWTSPANEDPAWSAIAPGFRRLTREELEFAFGVAEGGAARNRGRGKTVNSAALEAPSIVDGWTFLSAAAQPSRYLPWLARRAEAAGVKLEKRELGSLDELFVLVVDEDGGEDRDAAAAGDDGDDESSPSPSPSTSRPRRPLFDVVINCAGLEGGALARDDASPPQPVRGQVARLLYPGTSSSSWEEEWKRTSSESKAEPAALSLFLDEETYLIKNVDFVVAGGTGQVGDNDTTPRQADKESILARVSLLSPSLVSENLAKEAEKEIEDWAGLRPLRSPVRLDSNVVKVEVEEKESEESSTSTNKSKNVLVVSNYGHGGSGFTLHWGCARDAMELVFEGLRDI